MAQAAARFSSAGTVLTPVGQHVSSSEAWRGTGKAAKPARASLKECNKFLRGSFPGNVLKVDSLTHRQPVTSQRSLGARARVATKGEVNVGEEIRLLARYPDLLKRQELDIELPMHQPRSGNDSLLDILVVGAGPAGLSVAQRASAAGLRVCCVDPGPKSIWPNNYGVWIDEFEAMGLTDCLDYTWPKARVWLDGSDKRSLDRPYGRVNRNRLKTKLLEGCAANGVTFYEAKVEGVVHDDAISTITCSNGTVLSARVVVDASGHSRSLVKYDQPFDPGYQVAYGVLAEVKSHPLEQDAMLFMDWRDTHLDPDPQMKQRNKELPTFLYAMPLTPTKIFLEETSLVARPGIPFEEVMARFDLRMKHLGIEILGAEEEEFCYIPMGGVLPLIPQRVLGIGGTAGMVHPSTGYMVARTLAAAPQLADSIIARLKPSHSVTHVSQNLPRGEVDRLAASNGASTSGRSETATATQVRPAGGVEGLAEGHVAGDDLSAAIWADLWPVDRVEQREFFCFGMDVLLKLDLDGTRRFFSAFFSLSPYHWQGFLSSRLYFLELIQFGLSLFKHASNTARLEIMWKGLPGLGVMIQHLVTMKR
ncbi:lycopene beta cyclase [Klebsormidium nitens]|uniref:lycopene beta-cyclase n=1 Tax=Klebsormidium nitens TaxID=105231 RepID=A0A1Y1I7D1_KLENI|nr:lycopene beta cyclase [Klebsormidium nitens]|eukprot:GAQ85842.1 lycopene beta cyclase [Klebsormidium nitens]